MFGFNENLSRRFEACLFSGIEMSNEFRQTLIVNHTNNV